MDKATNRNRSTISEVGESGESGEDSSPHMLRPDHGATDQLDRQWLGIKKGKTIAYVSLDMLTSGNMPLISAIFRKQGMVILSKSHISRFAAAAESLSYDTRILVVDRPGWVEGLFGFGDGTVFLPKSYSSPIVNVILGSKDFQVSCTLKEYWRAFLPIVRNQEFLLFALAMAFLPPLLELFRKRGISMDNVIFDFCCKSSKGKTGGFIRFPGSVWGTGSMRTGFGRSWNTTGGGVDDTLREFNGCFLGLDEANKAGRTPKERADFISNAVFTIASGDPRKSKTEVYDPRSATVVCASTSNVPLLAYADADKETAEAIAVRCNTIVIDEDRPYGVFSHLPEGYTDSADLAAELTSLTQRLYGAPIRSFLQRLVKERAADEDTLLTQMMEYYNKFMVTLDDRGNDGQANRKNAAFAMVYAAGRLARKWGIIPESEDIGNLKSSCVKVWRCVASADVIPSDTSPRHQIINYVKAHMEQLLRVNDPDVMTDDIFQTHPGFLKMGKAGIQELVLSRARFATLKLSVKSLDELKSQGILICDVGRNDAKRTVRIRPEGDNNERVMVINLSALGVKVSKGQLKTLK